MKNLIKMEYVAMIVILLFIINMGATYLIVDYKTKAIANNVIAKNLAIEYDKVGGIENYAKITKITREQTVAGLKQYEAQQGNVQVPTQANNAPSNTINEISKETLKKVTGTDNYILGNPDAEITWVEYSDLECPFCKKLHQSGTIDEVMKAYDGKVNFIFKQFPLDFHKQASMEAEAVLCAADIAGKDKYYDFIGKVFENSEARGNSYTMESITKLGGTLGIDETKLKECLDSGKYAQRVADEMSEGQSLFGITGTPGNVLINNKTGKWDKLPGAYPTDSFKQKIDSLLQ